MTWFLNHQRKIISSLSRKELFLKGGMKMDLPWSYYTDSSILIGYNFTIQKKPIGWTSKQLVLTIWNWLYYRSRSPFSASATSRESDTDCGKYLDHQCISGVMPLCYYRNNYFDVVSKMYQNHQFPLWSFGKAPLPIEFTLDRTLHVWKKIFD